MAVVVAAVFAGVDTKTWSVDAQADADTAGTITHGFGAAPALVTIRPIVALAYTAQWVIASVSASEIILGKTSAATSSSSGTPQIRVQARRPHSIGA